MGMLAFLKLWKEKVGGIIKRTFSVFESLPNAWIIL